MREEEKRLGGYRAGGIRGKKKGHGAKT